MAVIVAAVECSAARPFAQVPTEWLTDTRLSPGARLTLAILLTNRPGFPLACSRLAREVGVRNDTLSKYLRELRELGYLAETDCRGEDGRVRGSGYVMIDLHLAGPTENRVHRVPEKPGTGETGTNYNIPNNTTPTNEISEMAKPPAAPPQPRHAHEVVRSVEKGGDNRRPARHNSNWELARRVQRETLCVNPLGPLGIIKKAVKEMGMVPEDVARTLIEMHSKYGKPVTYHQLVDHVAQPATPVVRADPKPRPAAPTVAPEHQRVEAMHRVVADADGRPVPDATLAGAMRLAYRRPGIERNPYFLPSMGAVLDELVDEYQATAEEVVAAVDRLADHDKPIVFEDLGTELYDVVQERTWAVQ